MFTPPFLLPALIIGVVGGFLGKAYIKTQLSIKREMSTAKAPVLGLFNGAIVGLSKYTSKCKTPVTDDHLARLASVRAYNAQHAFKTLLREHINHYVRVKRSYWNINRCVPISHVNNL